MLATSASILILVCWAISFAHWHFRGGRLWYFPRTRRGRIVFTLATFAVLAVSVMVLLSVAGANALMFAFAVAAIMDVSYSCWRREHALPTETKVA